MAPDFNNVGASEENGASTSFNTSRTNSVSEAVASVLHPPSLNPITSTNDIAPSVLTQEPVSMTPSAAPIDSGSSPLSPLHMVRQSTLPSDTGSDSHSVRSANSAGPPGMQGSKHQDLHYPGLSASVIESISATFEEGIVKKAIGIGEIALAHNTEESLSNSVDLIRISNFDSIEKIVPNTNFVTPVETTSGEYRVSLSHIQRTSVSFKYQLRLDETMLQTYPPVIITQVWKLENHQASLIFTYKPNASYFNGHHSKGVVRNITFTAGIEGVQAASCQSKPAGIFDRERGRIVWKIPELRLDEQGGKLIARFSTDGPARTVPAEARWEINSADDGHAEVSGEHGIRIERLTVENGTAVQEKDPFADETEEQIEARRDWREIPIVKKTVSGRYIAV